jgi:hypothetical protein
MSGYRVVPARAKRVTARQAPCGKGTATGGPEARYGNARIVGAGRVETAARAQPGTQDTLVEGEQKEY